MKMALPRSQNPVLYTKLILAWKWHFSFTSNIYRGNILIGCVMYYFIYTTEFCEIVLLSGFFHKTFRSWVEKPGKTKLFISIYPDMLMWCYFNSFRDEFCLRLTLALITYSTLVQLLITSPGVDERSRGKPK